jgi:hypothetical protein
MGPRRCSDAGPKQAAGQSNQVIAEQLSLSIQSAKPTSTAPARPGARIREQTLSVPLLLSEVSVVDGMIGFVDQQQSGDDYKETVTSWTNPHTAEYKRREQMLMNTRGYEVTALLRELNLVSYAFSANALDLQKHVERFPIWR